VRPPNVRPLSHRLRHSVRKHLPTMRMPQGSKGQEVNVHFISLGAGVQSSTLALMAAAGEITPMPEAAVFADTQREPKAVYEWLKWLETQLPFPVLRVTKGDLYANAVRLRTSKDGNNYQGTLSQVTNFRGTPFLHRSCLPLDQVDFSAPVDNQLNLFENECTGMCGV
jgi:hypothetical protein